MHDQRLILLNQWLEKHFSTNKFLVTKLAGDASFRRYFRVHKDKQTFVVMDAPPDKENSESFVAIAQAFAKNGIKVPEILAVDLSLGFLLLSDLGDKVLLPELGEHNADYLYQKALAVIPQIQPCMSIPNWPLAKFGDQLALQELQLFPEWFLQKHLELPFDQEINHLLTATFSQLIQIINDQPQVCVHRDYHSRNLLCLENNEIGVLDFQDAVIGPITYDAVSLLRDCYVAWPEQDVARWLLYFYNKCVENGNLNNISPEQFTFWFDFVGIQRHLKVLGIFARLYYRDGKDGYLKEMPRISQYILSVSIKYPSLKPFRDFFETTVMSRY